MSLRLGLALGGGAARGLAHLGVLEVLLAAGHVPRVVVGTSFGSLAGAAVVAGGLSPEAARAAIAGVQAYARSDAFRRSKLGMFRRREEIEGGRGVTIREVVRRGIASAYDLPDATLVPSAEVRGAIGALLPDRAIESLPCTFATVAADLATGEELLFDRGSLRLAVEASCAIPGLMAPVAVGGRRALDGGWVEKVPAGPARELGAEVVVAIDVSDELADTADLQAGLNVVHRGDAIRSHRLKVLQLREADEVVRCELGRVGWADFELAAEIIAEGRRAAEASLPRIAAALDRASSPGATLRRLARRLSQRATPEDGAVVRCAAQPPDPSGR